MTLDVQLLSNGGAHPVGAVDVFFTFKIHAKQNTGVLLFLPLKSVRDLPFQIARLHFSCFCQVC